MQNVDSFLVQTVLEDISKFSGDKNEDVNNWLVINQKFDACELTGPHRQKWAIAFLSDDALKWHTRNAVKFETWNDFQTALKDNFPPPPAPSSSIIFHQLLSRKQGNTELFNCYYADIIKLCHRYDPLMSDDTRCDILKSGMNKMLLDKCCGKGFTSTHELREFIERFEQDQQFIRRHLPPPPSSSLKPSSLRPLFTTLNPRALNTLHSQPRTPLFRPRPPLRSCFNCGDSRHLIRTCPTKRQRTTVTCNPSLIFINVYVNNRKIRALLESGASHSFVTRAALSKVRHGPLLPSTNVAHLADSSGPLHVSDELKNIFIKNNEEDSNRSTVQHQHSLFDQLPTELFYLLFNYLWAHEILQTFSNLNYRIKSIIKSYSNYRINFESIRKSTFHLICRSIRPDQVISLILSDKNDTIGQSKLFLSYFQIEQFINLRSILLLEIETESLYKIIPNLSKLKQLHSVSLGKFEEKGEFVSFIHKKSPRDRSISSLLTEPCAEIFPQLKYLYTINFDILTSIHFPCLLHFKMITLSSHDVSEILQHAPQLKSLTLFPAQLDDSHEISPCYSLRNLTLILNYIFYSMDDVEKFFQWLEKFLQNFPNLIHFEIKHVRGCANHSLIDGCRWQKIAQSFSTFNFKFIISQKANEQDLHSFQTPFWIERDLNSFRTPFWIEEKRWFVAYHDHCLFTISDFDLSNTIICSNSFIYSTIPNNSILYRPKDTTFQREDPLNNNFRFTSVKNLKLNWKASVEILLSFIDLNQIEYLRTTIHKEIQWKQIRALELSTSSRPKNKFKRLTSISFSTHDASEATLRSSELDADLIVHNIEQYFHCTVTCRIELYNALPYCIHLWLGDRNDQRQPRFGYLWYKTKTLFQ
ncbi:unnamed protein product [Didymodactylos carnosus]|uniref:CCHC-type domain-containing protein n=1 Tax=Didymodactylos carnosus TaxID=1234261 RepID=A0A814QX90_9BILA|nr:unnamed protein product [Didymodactylos carnosus]CAF3889265.1 unnamed protein product [Didymodactylos carnosus]